MEWWGIRVQWNGSLTGRRWGLLVPCALKMYSEASIVVTFPYISIYSYIFCMGLDARIYIPHLSCRVDKPFLGEKLQTVLIFLSRYLRSSF